MVQCKICGNKENNLSFNISENMLGLKIFFEYIECGNCKCLQIVTIPENLSKYYPIKYYSFSIPKINRLKRLLKRIRFSQSFGNKRMLGKILVKRYGEPQFVDWIKNAEVGLNDTILDVGSGNGKLLLDMSNAGFSNLVGIDPYIENEINYDNGVRILKCSLIEVRREFDFVMLHHSFEHFQEPLSELKEIYRILKPNKYVLIRIPIAGNYAWNKYNINWVQLDAPRHFYLHSKKSILILADQAGFVLEKIIYDSKSMQFWASEQYCQNISLIDSRSYQNNPHKSIFNREDIELFEKKTIELNEKSEGDQACFYLRKVQ